MYTLIAPNDTWGLWAILLGAAAFGLLAERTRWGARLSGAVITLLTAFACSNLKLIPASAPVYDMVWSYLVPLAIPLLLLKADLNRIMRESGVTLVAFLLGALGTVLGTVVAFYCIPLGQHAWQLAGIFSATYIGGSMNYMAVAEALGLRSGDLLTAGMAADNLMMTLYFLVLFTLPSLRPVWAWFGEGPFSTPRTQSMPVPEHPVLQPPALATAFALSAGLCALGYGLEMRLDWQGSAILIITAVAVLLATLLPDWVGKLPGTQEAGMLLMQVFFAAIGASANIAMVLKVGPVLFIFAGLILVVHLSLILLGGKWLGLNLPEVLIASNANIGGPTTAAAMAASLRWHPLVVPAILCGTLGYAIATFIGVALGKWLH